MIDFVQSLSDWRLHYENFKHFVLAKYMKQNIKTKLLLWSWFWDRHPIQLNRNYHKNIVSTIHAIMEHDVLLWERNNIQEWETSK